ncbi:MAG: hypothetical protein CMK32_03550 [Porticoccaceae bacterium]|nr:hypothetical protein [Porticoccaceae bacterium]
MSLLLNCDLGEIEDPQQHIERTVMPLIDMANIACGFHAGSPMTMRNTLNLAKTHQVTIGAHPGYGDRTNFGRMSIPHSHNELVALLHYQISALAGMAKSQELALSYVKPHGALYHDMMNNADIRRAVLAALAECDGGLSLMMLATGEADRHRKEAKALGIDIIFEAFADRAYDDTGRLVDRRQSGAVHDHSRMLDQARQLIESGTVTTISGKRLPIAADSLCVHGDNPAGVAVIAELRSIVNLHHRHA